MVEFGEMENNDQAHLREIKKEVLELLEQKTKLENELIHHSQILKASNVGFNDPLVDDEGFPRSDIDVYQIRTSRVRIIYLKNDLKNVMGRIEDGIHEIHAGTKPDQSAGDEPMEQQLSEPFASITIVSPGSPADLCGLKVSDVIIEFGSVNISNFKSMQDLAVVVRHSAGQKIRILVRRMGRHFNMDLTPQPWSGQGLIGCKIEPLAVETIER